MSSSFWQYHPNIKKTSLITVTLPLSIYWDNYTTVYMVNGTRTDYISTCPVGIVLGRENENHLFIVFVEGKNCYSLGKKCEQPFCLVLRKYAEPIPDTCMCRRIKTPQAWVVLSGHFTWHQKQDTVHTTVNLMIDKKSWFYEELLELITLIPYN